MEKIMHRAAQYLATSAISFIPKKEDDSHTNLGWVNQTLETHPFENGDKLGLNYKHFSLEWIHSNGNREHLFLNNLKHKEIIEWITHMSAKNHIQKKFSYNLHYDLPYKTITDTTVFKLTKQDDLDQLIANRELSQNVISSVLKSNHYVSPIRIWPHHFDTGAFVIVSKTLSIGLGMAIPDTIIDDFYFYISGYSNDKPIDLKFSDHTQKQSYYSNGFKGFAKAITKLNEASAIEFVQMAINNYLNSVK